MVRMMHVHNKGKDRFKTVHEFDHGQQRVPHKENANLGIPVSNQPRGLSCAFGSTQIKSTLFNEGNT